MIVEDDEDDRDDFDDFDDYGYRRDGGEGHELCDEIEELYHDEVIGALKKEGDAVKNGAADPVDDTEDSANKKVKSRKRVRNFQRIQREGYGRPRLRDLG